jgi:hypothetical protein
MVSDVTRNKKKYQFLVKCICYFYSCLCQLNTVKAAEEACDTRTLLSVFVQNKMMMIDSSFHGADRR